MLRSNTDTRPVERHTKRLHEAMLVHSLSPDRRLVNEPLAAMRSLLIG